jgi:hypothetical protein
MRAQEPRPATDVEDTLAGGDAEILDEQLAALVLPPSHDVVGFGELRRIKGET